MIWIISSSDLFRKWVKLFLYFLKFSSVNRVIIFAGVPATIEQGGT